MINQTNIHQPTKLPSTAHDYTSNSNDIVIFFFDILLHSENLTVGLDGCGWRSSSRVEIGYLDGLDAKYECTFLRVIDFGVIACNSFLMIVLIWLL